VRYVTIEQQQRKVAVRVVRPYNFKNHLVVGQSPTGMNMSTETEDIVGIRQQATTGEVISD
jgi:hypothetical protein